MLRVVSRFPIARFQLTTGSQSVTGLQQIIGSQSSMHLLKDIKQYYGQSLAPKIETPNTEKSRTHPIAIEIRNDSALPFPSRIQSSCDCEYISDCKCRVGKLIQMFCVDNSELNKENQEDEEDEEDEGDEVFTETRFKYCSEKINGLPACILRGICICVKP